MSRHFVLGAVCGSILSVSAVAMFGMSPRAAGGDWHVTSSADGRSAYLWSVGDDIQFISSARAKTGGKDKDREDRDDRDDDDHDDDNGDDGDGGEGKGKGKGQGKGKGKGKG